MSSELLTEKELSFLTLLELHRKLDQIFFRDQEALLLCDIDRAIDELERSRQQQGYRFSIDILCARPAIYLRKSAETTPGLFTPESDFSISACDQEPIRTRTSWKARHYSALINCSQIYESSRVAAG